MTSLSAEKHLVETRKQIVDVRKRIIAFAEMLGMSAMKQAELRTAATELLSNMARYAGKGVVHIELLPIDSPRGLRVIFEDEGPGIPDIELAMQNGFTTGTSLGHGLAACKNMVNFFELLSAPGKGTRVEIQKWC